MNAAYPLLPVTIIIFLAYFTTRIFAGWKIFSIKWHRKFWNYILLGTFLVTGLFGLLSVVKVNYKLEIPYYEMIMQWHVAFGIALFFVAFFHFSWHLKYYFTFKKKEKKKEVIVPEMAGTGYVQFRVLLIVLGTVTMVNQIVFIREFISVLSGNELIVGVIMALWMLLTGWGARQARNGSFTGFSFKRGIIMLAALTISPMLLIALLYLLKSLLFPPGSLVNIGNSIVAAFILLFPVCFLSGYLFTAFSTFCSKAKKTDLTGRSYALESIGSLIGGVLFSIILGRFFNSFQIFGITASAVLLTGAWLIWQNDRGRIRWLIVIGVLVPLLVFFFNPDTVIKKLSFPNQELISNQGTRYGNVVITRQAGQVNVYENNNLQFYTDNVMVNEEAVHYSMVQHKNPRQVLLISGGIAGMIREILKYNVEKVTYLEPNPEIFRLLKDFTETLPSPSKTEIVKRDIRRFIREVNRKYDVILINLPPPSSLRLNRFYTEEFFHTVKKLCTAETIVITSLPSTANYSEGNALGANSSLWKTLGLDFKYRLLLTGEKNYFLASDTLLSSAIAEKISEKNIPTEYVNHYYLDDELLSMRSRELASRFDSSVPVNRDFYPYMFIKQINYWLSYFGSRYYLLILVPGVLFLLIFFSTDKITAGLYTGGFSAASLEVALLLAYQVYFGNIYLVTALFFAVFMSGLAFGSSVKYKNKFPAIKKYYFLQFALAVFAITVPYIIQFVGIINKWQWLMQAIFFILIFILASSIGFEFLLASKLRQKGYSENAGVNYSTDLAGSAFGAFFTAIVLLPYAGLVKTCLIVAVLNIVSGSLAFSMRKQGILSI